MRLKKLQLKKSLKRLMKLIRYYLIQKKELNTTTLVTLLLNKVDLVVLKVMVNTVVDKTIKILTLVISTLTSMNLEVAEETKI